MNPLAPARTSSPMRNGASAWPSWITFGIAAITRMMCATNPIAVPNAMVLNRPHLVSEMMAPRIGMVSATGWRARRASARSRADRPCSLMRLMSSEESDRRDSQARKVNSVVMAVAGWRPNPSAPAVSWDPFGGAPAPFPPSGRSCWMKL